MPDQLFVFSANTHIKLVIVAASEEEAVGMLRGYLERHPNVPRMDEWNLCEVAAKYEDGVFGIADLPE